MRDPFLNPGFPALCECGDKEAAAGCFSQHKPIPWKWLQDPPRLYLPEELVGLSREGAELPCLPHAPGLASLALILAGSLLCPSCSEVWP